MAGLPRMFSFIKRTGLAPRYLGLESVSLPVIESIEVRTIMPF